MQACIFDKETYIYINPLQYEGIGELIDNECVIRCKYCKGENILLERKINKQKYVCSICECHNELPTNYKATDIE